MKKQKGKKPEALKVDGEKLKNDLPLALTAISEKILGKCKSFLHNSLKHGKLMEADLDRLCFIFNLNKEDYIVVEEEPVQEEEPVVEVTPATTEVNLDGVTERIDKLVDTVAELTKVVSTVVEAQIATKKEIEETELGILAINELLKGYLDSINTELAKTNSNLNIVKGRLGDLCGVSEVKKSA